MNSDILLCFTLCFCRQQSADLQRDAGNPIYTPVCSWIAEALRQYGRLFQEWNHLAPSLLRSRGHLVQQPLFFASICPDGNTQCCFSKSRTLRRHGDVCCFLVRLWTGNVATALTGGWPRAAVHLLARHTVCLFNSLVVVGVVVLCTGMCLTGWCMGMLLSFYTDASNHQ